MILVQELKLTNRSIVTNLAVKIPELAEQLNERYGDCFNLNRRLRILTPEETMCFWYFPAPGVDLDPREKMVWNAIDGSKLTVPKLDLIQQLGGTLWLIDEAHIPFSSRNWQSNKESKDAGFYFLSQHEKFRSDVILITQHVERVDNQFRSIAAGFVYMKNKSISNLPIWGGIIKQMPGFVQTKYDQPFKDGMGSIETKKYKTADKLWMANCYDTTAGVGIVSREDGRFKKVQKGIPFWMLSIPVVALILFLAYVPDAILQSVAGSVHDAGKISSQTNMVAKSQVDPPAPARAAAPGDGYFLTIPKIRQTTESAKSQVWVTGWVPTPDKKKLHVYLSDGRCLSEGYRFVKRNLIEYEGELFYAPGVPNGF